MAISRPRDVNIAGRHYAEHHCFFSARELEKAIERYEADPTKDDIFLADAVERGIDLLNGYRPRDIA